MELNRTFCDGCDTYLEIGGESLAYLFGKEHPGMHSIAFQISTNAGPPGAFCKQCCATMFKTLGGRWSDEVIPEEDVEHVQKS